MHRQAGQLQGEATHLAPPVLRLFLRALLCSFREPTFSRDNPLLGRLQTGEQAVQLRKLCELLLIFWLLFFWLRWLAETSRLWRGYSVLVLRLRFRFIVIVNSSILRCLGRPFIGECLQHATREQSEVNGKNLAVAGKQTGRKGAESFKARCAARVARLAPAEEITLLVAILISPVALPGTSSERVEINPGFLCLLPLSLSGLCHFLLALFHNVCVTVKALEGSESAVQRMQSAVKLAT